MNQKRFEMIWRALSLNESKKSIEFDLNILINNLNEKFKKYYNLGKYISIDESIIPFKGKSKYKIYMKRKPHKWGLKYYSLCDSLSKYTYKIFFVFENKHFHELPEKYKNLSLSNKITIILTNNIWGKNHLLFIDRFLIILSL